MTYPGSPPPGYPQPPIQGFGDLSRPLYDATIGQAVGRFWRKYAVFTGRASRSEFWWWYLVAFLVSSAFSAVNYAIVGFEVMTFVPGQDPRQFILESLRVSLERSIGPIIWSLATLVGQIALSTRRLHDTGRSGWWYLISFVPLVGFIILVVFWADAPRPEGQRYDR